MSRWQRGVGHVDAIIIRWTTSREAWPAGEVTTTLGSPRQTFEWGRSFAIAAILQNRYVAFCWKVDKEERKKLSLKRQLWKLDFFWCFRSTRAALLLAPYLPTLVIRTTGGIFSIWSKFHSWCPIACVCLNHPGHQDDWFDQHFNHQAWLLVFVTHSCHQVGGCGRWRQVRHHWQLERHHHHRQQLAGWKGNN